MGSRRVDRYWPKPRRTRHVWIKSDSTLRPPTQGLILDWRRRGYKWSALVLYVGQDEDATSVLIQRWFPAERLLPIRSDSNDGSPSY